MSADVSTRELAKLIGVTMEDIHNWIKRGLVPDFDLGFPLGVAGRGNGRKFGLKTAYFMALVSDLRQVISLAEAAATAKSVIDYDMDDCPFVYAKGGRVFFNTALPCAVVVFSPLLVMQRLKEGWPK